MDITRQYEMRRSLVRSSRWDTEPTPPAEPEPTPAAPEPQPEPQPEPAAPATPETATLGLLSTYCTARFLSRDEDTTPVYAITATGETVPLVGLTTTPPKD